MHLPPLLAALSVVIAQAGQAQPWMDSFDPSACPGDHRGQVAVRLVSGFAFRFPAEVFSVRDPSPPPEDASLPPYGCPGNPIVARAVSTNLGHMQFLPEGFEPHRKFRRPVGLTIFGHDGPMGFFDGVNRNVDEGPGRRSMTCLTASDAPFELCNGCPTEGWSDDGFCRLTFDDGRSTEREPGFWARALPGTHPESEGLPLVASCDGGDQRDFDRAKHRPCEAGIAYAPDLAVIYGYDGNIVTLPLLPGFDLAMREWIEERRAPDLDSQARIVFEER